MSIDFSTFQSDVSQKFSTWWESKSAEEQGDLESMLMIFASALGTVVPMLIIALW